MKGEKQGAQAMFKEEKLHACKIYDKDSGMICCKVSVTYSSAKINEEIKKFLNDIKKYLVKKKWSVLKYNPSEGDEVIMPKDNTRRV